MLYKKIEMPCSKKRASKSFDDYVDNDNKVRDMRSIDPYLVEELRKVRDYVIPLVFSTLDADCYFGNLLPRHGPGATAERIFGNSKYAFKRWHTRLEDYFPAEQFAIPNFGFAESLQDIDFVTKEFERPVRVIQVPKTLKAPRTIAIEPVCMQYTQQSLCHKMVDLLESNKLTKGHVNFRDQDINASLALSSSKNGLLATIDLKDASDMVSLEMVEFLFENLPHLRNAILACRSSTASVNGSTISLKKFASMGSAMCFPIEAVVFYCLSLLGCVLAEGRLFTRWKVPISEVYVYGDDIIIPTNKAPTVIRTLEAFGLKVNRNKSFYTGKFRESCGTDAYDGYRVTPTYVRMPHPLSQADTRSILSLVSTANQLADKLYWNAANYLKSVVEGFLGPLPSVSRDCPGIGWFWGEFPARQRMCPHLHKPLVYTYVAHSQRVKDPLSGHPALLKWFLFSEQGASQFLEKSHLEVSVRNLRSVSLRRRWVPSY
jgi:hypothetical protein